MRQEATFFYKDFVSVDMKKDIDEIRIRHRFETCAKTAQANGEALAEVDRQGRSP